MNKFLQVIASLLMHLISHGVIEIANRQKFDIVILTAISITSYLIIIIISEYFQKKYIITL